MPHGIGAAAAGRLRRGRPEAAAVFVANVDRLAAHVGDRIVGPGGEPELVAVVHPRAAAARFGDHGADTGIGQAIDPWCGRADARVKQDHIFAPISREAAEAVEGVELGRFWPRLQVGGSFRRCRLCTPPPRLEWGDRDLRSATLLHLLDQRASFVGEHDAGGGLQQHPVLLGELFTAAHKDAARAVDEPGLRTGGDEVEDRLVQHLPVDGVVFVPDDEVHVEAVHPPPAVPANRLLHEFELVAIADANQHDRQVTRDTVPPQPRLATAVAGDHRRARASQPRRVDKRPSQPSVGLRFLLRDRKLLQHDRAPRPGQFDDAIGEARIGIFDGDLSGLIT